MVLQPRRPISTTKFLSNKTRSWRRLYLEGQQKGATIRLTSALAWTSVLWGLLLMAVKQNEFTRMARPPYQSAPEVYKGNMQDTKCFHFLMEWEKQTNNTVFVAENTWCKQSVSGTGDKCAQYRCSCEQCCSRTLCAQYRCSCEQCCSRTLCAQYCCSATVAHCAHSTAAAASSAAVAHCAHSTAAAASSAAVAHCAHSTAAAASSAAVAHCARSTAAVLQSHTVRTVLLQCCSRTLCPRTDVKRHSAQFYFTTYAGAECHDPRGSTRRNALQSVRLCFSLMRSMAFANEDCYE
jgi:hypothetical protein